MRPPCQILFRRLCFSPFVSSCFFWYVTNLCELLPAYGGILVYKFEEIENFFSYFQSLDIQECALKKIFQNFNYFMTYSHFYDAASAPIRPEKMNNRSPSTCIVFYPFLMYF